MLGLLLSKHQWELQALCCSNRAICVQPAGREFTKQDLNPVLTFPVSFDKTEVSRKVATMGEKRWPSTIIATRSGISGLQEMSRFRSSSKGRHRQLLMNTLNPELMCFFF